MSKQRFFKGTLILTFTGLLSRLLGFFYRIFLSHSIGAQGLGIYQLAIPMQSLVLAVTAAGIQAALSRLCAAKTALGREKEARDYFFLGALTAVFLSFVLSFFIFQKGDFFAVQILKEPRTAPLIRLLSFSFPLNTLHSCINSYYFSRKKAGLPSAIQLLEQVSRMGAGYILYLILLSQGREITPIIAAGGTLFSEIIACIASLLAIGLHFRANHYTPANITAPLEKIRDILRLSVPHSLNRLLLTLLGSIEIVLIPQQLRAFGLSASEALSIYGIFTGMALPLILFPSTITNSASVMLMPSVAELQALGYKKRIDYVISRTSRYCLLLGLGCAVFFFVFGNFLGLFLFKSPTAGVYIRTMSFICPFLYMNTALTSILNGLGRPNTCLCHSVIGVCIRICFVLFAIPKTGIRGYLYGILLSELLLSALHLQALYHLKPANFLKLESNLPIDN